MGTEIIQREKRGLDLMSQDASLNFDPLGDEKSLLEYIQHMGSDAMIVRAARVSFANDPRPFEPDTDVKLLSYLLKNKHSSPFEHCYVTFHVSCPIFVKNQWTRHRTWPYWNLNEVSRRYTSEDIEFYYPDEWRGQSESNRQASDGVLQNPYITSEYVNTVSSCIESYNRMLKVGVAREQARMVLPQSMYTRFYASANLHNILHFITLRDDPHAQKEVMLYARSMVTILDLLYPVTMEAYRRVRDGV